MTTRAGPQRCRTEEPLLTIGNNNLQLYNPINISNDSIQKTED